MHGHFADDAIAVFADLAGEDVAVFSGQEVAAPAAGRGRTGAVLCVAFAAGFGCFVESPKERVSTSSSGRWCSED